MLICLHSSKHRIVNRIKNESSDLLRLLILDRFGLPHSPFLVLRILAADFLLGFSAVLFHHLLVLSSEKLVLEFIELQLDIPLLENFGQQQSTL